MLRWHQYFEENETSEMEQISSKARGYLLVCAPSPEVVRQEDRPVHPGMSAARLRGVVTSELEYSQYQGELSNT